MKRLSLLLLPIIILSCYEDDDTIPQIPVPPPCLDVACEVEDEFFGKAIMNGECWIADRTSLRYNTISLNKNAVDNVEEHLSISLSEGVNLKDTIWIGYTNAGNPAPNIALTYYGYQSGHQLLGTFGFEFGAELTYKDYLVIDYFNADTSIMEGRFQLRFPLRLVSSFANAPDSMRLGCGSFRVKSL